MALSYEMKKLIDAMTQEVIKIYGIQIPITDIDEVVGSMGGDIREDPTIDRFSDGRIRKSGSESFVIEVSPYQSEERRNFTIAHELGHLFLHMGFQTNEQRWKKQADVSYYRNGNSELEYQSNEFAAALLMPRDEFKRVMDEHTDGSLVNTAEIARYFHVSVSAAANRGKWL